MRYPRSAGLIVRLWFVANEPSGENAAQELRRIYGDWRSEKPDAIVVLGGNSTLIRLLPKVVGFNVPVFPMNLGTGGFLTNSYQAMKLPLIIQSSRPAKIAPIEVEYSVEGDEPETALAFNEVVLYRGSRKMAEMNIWVDDALRVEGLRGDGVLVATPAGSTAYNLSARGPILPLTSRLLALTPLAPFHPKLWEGSVLPETSRIVMKVCDGSPVELAADHSTKGRVTQAQMSISGRHSVTLLYAWTRDFDERQLTEQFAH